MGMFDNLKNIQDMVKGMSPDQIQQLMKQAGDAKGAMEDAVRKVLDEEIKKRGLVSRDEVEEMIENKIANRG